MITLSDPSVLDTQRIGRMGELVVELELLARGWMVGNFNATTMNSAGWDLFATKGNRSVKLRVKAKRPGTTSFVWSRRKDGGVLPHLDPAAEDDFVAAVDFTLGGLPVTYIVPALTVETALLTSHAAWLAGAKRDGTARKDTSTLRLHIDDRADAGPGHGFAVFWASYSGAWRTLEF